MTPIDPAPDPSWGRWGPDDERGALNTLGPRAVARGLACVVDHVAVSLAAPIVAGRSTGAVGRPAPAHHMLRDGGDYAAGLPERGGFGFSDDVITLPTHGVTHLDALAHIWKDGLMYNGHPSTEVSSRGARRLGIHTVGPILTRGVFVDLVPAGRSWLDPGEAVGVADLRAKLDAADVTLEPGDALLVRTGWTQAWIAGENDPHRWPGLHADCADWLAEQDLALVGADNIGVEAFPSSDPDCQVPLHLALLRGHGVIFCELLDLAALAETGRSTFLFIASPLNLVGAVGGPVAPVALL
ncbi:cyclase family protein [Sporichthya polymorpha]|uniref:cyclase family protein n=1 Tax=Sporichthya polymorpha TaxID=35751 RepID=UPI00048CAD04|nr:cyclase family protein [Sporichthya polymorpha]